MQRERMTDSFVPSLREYAARYQIDGRRLGAAPGAHAPGPGQPRGRARRRGDRLAAGRDRRQVAAGVVVRMAVLYELLAGRARAAARRSDRSR